MGTILRWGSTIAAWGIWWFALEVGKTLYERGEEGWLNIAPGDWVIGLATLLLVIVEIQLSSRGGGLDGPSPTRKPKPHEAGRGHTRPARAP